MPQHAFVSPLTSSALENHACTVKRQLYGGPGGHGTKLNIARREVSEADPGGGETREFPPPLDRP